MTDKIGGKGISWSVYLPVSRKKEKKNQVFKQKFKKRDTEKERSL